MRIQHNIPALNAHRNLTNNNSAVSKNLEKLSSGYRINRAGDDAAGLAISEKMRAQITGLQTAQKNAEDGVSLVQTAEGALTEVHSMLNRMVELATQAANGTYSTSNRQEMQKEINALNEEIDRISNTANFNGTNLFTVGAEGAGAVAQAAGATKTEAVTDITGTWNGATLNGTDVTAVAEVWETGAAISGVTDDTEQTVEIKYTDADGNEQTATIKATATDAGGSDFTAELAKVINADAGLKDIFTAADNGGKLTLTSKTAGAGKGTITSVKVGTGDQAGTVKTAGADKTKSFDLSATPKDGDKVTIDGKEYTFAAGADGTDGATFSDLATLKVAAAENGVTLNTGTNTAVTATKEVPEAADGEGVEINLHVGESSSESNTIKVKIKPMSSQSLGISDLSIETAADAKTAIDTVNAAIDTVSSIRSDLGALQNRLEHTINNLGVQTENITAAESRIRDVDMAKEMMAYTKNNILVQASQAMLAQANQVPQGVLQLLQ